MTIFSNFNSKQEKASPPENKHLFAVICTGGAGLAGLADPIAAVGPQSLRPAVAAFGGCRAAQGGDGRCGRHRRLRDRVQHVLQQRVLHDTAMLSSSTPFCKGGLPLGAVARAVHVTLWSL